MRWLVCAFLCLCSCVSQAQAKVIELKGGDRISGEVIAESEAAITIKPAYSDPIVIAREHIAPKKPKPAEKKEKTPDGWAHKGRISFGLDVEDGNTQSKDMAVDTKQEWESQKHRYTLKFDYDYGESKGVRDEEDGRLSGKYDYRFDERRYMLANLSFLRDVFQDIRLRSTAGVGYGYEWFSGEPLELKTEFGLNYVVEDLDNDSSNDYAALRWLVDSQYVFAEPKLTLFAELEGLMSIEDVENISMQGKTGLRMPVMKGWLAEVAWELDWENDAPMGKEALDSQYVVGVVYEW